MYKRQAYSAEFFEEEEETRQMTEEEAKKQEKKEKVLMNLTIALSVILALAIFMVLPYFLSNFLKKFTESRMVMVIFEGIIRVLIFLGYILLVSRMEDIQRTFMYHGAEHKCINCIESGLTLNVENVRKSSKQHKRCGTSFLFFVMLVSILFCFFITAESQVVRMLLRIALFPLIAGVSYEIIKLAGNSNNVFVELLSKPGMWIQLSLIHISAIKIRDTGQLYSHADRGSALSDRKRTERYDRISAKGWKDDAFKGSCACCTETRTEHASSDLIDR